MDGIFLDPILDSDITHHQSEARCSRSMSIQTKSIFELKVSQLKKMCLQGSPYTPFSISTRTHKLQQVDINYTGPRCLPE